MILPSRRARRWMLVALGLLAVLLASYVDYALSAPLVHGGSWMGIFYGVVASVLILVLLAFGLRKRAYRSTLGTLDGWLQAHLYLGLLSAVVVALHAGFRFHDRVATASFAVLLLVVATGFVGARLYATVPRQLTRVASNLTAEEISEQLNQLAGSMARLAAGRSESFRRIADRLLAETRPPSAAGWRLVFRGAGASSEVADESWEVLLALVAEEEREPLRKLLVLARQHRELHRRLRLQQRYQNLLQVWLYLHLPLSVALVVLVVAHVLGALYFRGL